MNCNYVSFRTIIFIVFQVQYHLLRYERKISLRPGFESQSGRVGFVVDTAAPRQVLSEYFGFS
jgi:hypothetical protein